MKSNLYFLCLIFALFQLSGCRPAVSPMEQVEKFSKPLVPSTQLVTPRRTLTEEYQCDGDKVLQIQRQAKSKKITLTFNQVSHRLSLGVSRSGKKYSNIRWTWREDVEGVGELRDNRQNRLAENCVKKEG